MDKALSDFAAEWEASNATKDRARARQMAIDYFAARPDRADIFAGKSLAELVGLVTACRRANNEAGRIEADMWLAAYHAPQHITGAVRMGAA